MSTIITTSEPITNNSKQDSTHAIDFGSGRYSPLMLECFKDAKVIFGLPSEKAEKLARQIGSDFGAAIREVQVDGRISKSLSKDGKVTLSEAAKIKVTQTNALGAMRAMQYANDSTKAGFVRNTTKWQVSEQLKEYFNTL